MIMSYPKSFTTSLKSLIFCLALAFSCQANADTVVVLGGKIGNADFEATESISIAGTFGETPHWFNASGSEVVDFTTDVETAGSSSPSSRACLPFQNRFQVNDTGHMVSSAGETFSMSFDFGRTGENWDGDESYRAFLFTTTEKIDESFAAVDITEVASIEYEVVQEVVWDNQVFFDSFYVTSKLDVGRTFFLGMVLSNENGSIVLPRLDEIHLIVDIQVLRGDVNLDGAIDLLDVAPFVELISGIEFQAEADINQDGAVDLLDVQPFVELLTGA